jgi:hypothetical protein
MKWRSQLDSEDRKLAQEVDSPSRRALLTGAAALAGGGLAKLAAPDTAAAGHNTDIVYDTQTVMHVDVTNTTAGSTRISSDIAGTAAFVALNDYPVGISRPDGMLGRTSLTEYGNLGGVYVARRSEHSFQIRCRRRRGRGRVGYRVVASLA